MLKRMNPGAMTDYKVMLYSLGSNNSNERNIQHKNRIHLHAARGYKTNSSTVSHFLVFALTC
jgi:hypothetical protein